MIKSIDESIQHCLEVAEGNENLSEFYYKESGKNTKRGNSCKDCAKEHRQLSEWLKDYKRLKEKEEPKDVVMTTNPVGWVMECPNGKITYAVICEQLPNPSIYFDTYEQAVKWAEFNQPTYRPFCIVKRTECFEICGVTKEKKHEDIT